VNLICNLPAEKVWVRKEYLQDHQDGHGEFVEGVWVSAKSIPGRAFYFETYLPEYGAMYDKLPISAFLRAPKPPTPDMSLENLQYLFTLDNYHANPDVIDNTDNYFWETNAERKLRTETSNGK